MDHPLDEHVVETEKYAFLLGCSLRENNLEQFFSVYDAILPKHLSESKLDKIKEEARQISELPQHSFDELVASARDFSLAQGRPKMSSLDGTLGPASPSEDDEDGTDGYIRGHRIFLGLGDNVDVLERDSGLPSSGKGTGSLCDMDGSDCEDRGVYDYFPPRSDTIKISHTTNPDFDEVHDVESDKSSIESPRSDASSTNEYNVTNPPDEEGIEMKVFGRQDETYSTRNLHTSFHHEIPYQVLRNDSDDEECRCTTVHEQRQYVRDCTFSMSRSVDDAVHFLTARNQGEVDSRDCQKHDSYVVGRQPPFGVEHQLRKVGGSIGKLLSSTGSTTNMPLGSEIDDRKKKNLRKKKGSKDDADERVGSSKSRKSCMSDDENGNPIDISSAYRQMRELPNKSSEGSVDSSGKHPNYGTYTQHGENSNFDVFPLEGNNSVKHCEEGPSNTDRKKLRKKTHRDRDQKCSLAEDIPNYVGNIASVDDLVKFIETDKFGEKQLKKISQKTSPTSEPAVKADKVTKKTKDKKLKVGQLEESFDVNFEIPEVVIHPTSALGEAPLSPPPAVTEAEVPVSPSETTEVFIPSTTDISVGEGHAGENTAEVMGNSGEKAAAVPATEVESQVALAGQETTQPGTTESKVVHTKDSEPPLDTNSSSRSPPLHKEIEHREKSKNKHKDGEKDKATEAAQAPPVLENKKQKSKNGKAEGQLKNNKKIENRNDIINNSKMVEKTKVENRPVKAASPLDNELSITENHQYIFTDIDNLPPVEQEFTLVSKKKKRQGGKEGCLELPRPKNSPREHRGVPPPRSVTPPPSSSSAIKEQTRDLSPSSFPALGKKGSSASKGRPTFREGRRNSFGDVPIDTLTELRSQDDSDIESVKSLPAAKGGSLSDVVSSRFPVSYAKMAAAPKLLYSPTSPHGEEEEEEELEDGDQESGSSRKPTVWKGSPTERRHSIGSSPEDSKQENSPKLTQRSRQKSGSQEFLLLDTMKVDNVQVSATIDLKAKTPINVQLVSMSSTIDNYIPDDERTNESPQELHNSSSNESLSIPTITLDAVTLAPNKVSGVIYKSDNNMVPKNGPSRRRLPQRTSKTEVVIATDLSRSQSTVTNAISSSKDPRGKPVPVPVRVVGNNCRKNNKSVIFMDKRFDDTPETLDITFGFDSNMEDDDKGTIIPSCREITYSVTMQSSSCDTKELVHNQTEPQSISLTILPKDSSTKSDQSAMPPTSQPSTRTTLNNVGGTTDLPDVVAQTIPVPNNKVSKTRVAGLNGVVQPKTQGYKNSQTPDALRTEPVIPAVRPPVASEPTVSPAAAPPHLPPSIPAPASNNKDNKTVLFFYGEGIVAKMGKSGVAIDSQDVEPTSQHKGQLAFSPDPNHRGKFNINEAVKYLRQEWDRVLDQRDKNPQAVQYYNGQ